MPQGPAPTIPLRNFCESGRLVQDNQVINTLLYVALHSKDDPYFGAVKLNKILFFADIEYYARHRRSASGFQYKKLPHGPVADGLDYTVRAIVREGKGSEETRVVGSHEQRRLVPSVEPDVAQIDDEFREILDRVIARLRHANASELSSATHEMRGWKHARHLEVIPLGTAFINTDPPTADERSLALTLD